MHSSTEVLATAERVIEGVDGMPLLPKVILCQTQSIELAGVSKTMYSIFKPVLNKFLQCVACGQQDKAEALFTRVYSGNPAKIQEALVHQGKFTDYSGRTFNCSAYEYAYWAKDIHMCRMLERYMDEETKALIFARINTNDEIGLPYQQNSEEHRSAHFDFTPLKEAYQRYFDSLDAWHDAEKLRAIDAAWLAIGRAQRDVPAHVAQEYCRPDRSFYPCPEFNEASLPRVLSIYGYGRGAWFPTPPVDGLGVNFSAARGGARGCLVASGLSCPGAASRDLAAITRLDEVRTAQLTQSREYLQSPAASHRFSS